MKPLTVLVALSLAGCVTTAAPERPEIPTTSTTISSTGMQGSGVISIGAGSDVRGSPVVLRADPARVWQVLPQVYAALGVPVKTIDSRSRTIGNTSYSLNRMLGGKRLSTYLSCGTAATGEQIADSYRVELVLLTTVRPAEAGEAAVETRVEATAVNRGAGGSRVQCATTGRLEQRIANELATRLTL